MHARVEHFRSCWTASGQRDVVSRVQATACGLGRHSISRLARDGRWHPLGRGHFLASPRPPDWESFAWAGCLVGGNGAVLGGRAAGYGHGLLEEPPSTVDVWVPGRPVPDSSPRWRFRLDGASGDPCQEFPGGPGVEDTLLDLAAVLPRSELLTVTFAALQTRRTTTGRLPGALARHRRVSHRDVLLDVLTDVVEGAESPLEARYLTLFERAHALPVGTR